MRTWRLIVLAALLLIPVAVFVCAGVWLLWLKGWWWWLWWMLPVCWGLAYFVARGSREDWHRLPFGELSAPRHWTPHDEAALRIVRARQLEVRQVGPERLTDARYYLDVALELGREIAQHYHPKSPDPVSNLTIPEILAVAHLACEDMERWARDYVPGSHLLTVSQWRAISKAPDWLRAAGNVSWAVSVFLQPANLARYFASRFAMDSATSQIQTNLLAWFYVTFVRYLGFYLIEMNSGRLRGGADRYREMIKEIGRGPGQLAEDSAAEVAGENAGASDTPLEVTIAVVGQLKAGKSSLINALLGEQQAATDILPLTQRVHRYALGLRTDRDRVTLLDTPGYGSHGPDDEQQREMEIASRNADLVLLALNATNPARQADLEAVRALYAWWGTQPRRRPAPVIGVLTHIDLLSPSLEWSPPYGWQHPETTKEHNIHGAVAHHAHLFAEQIAGVIPVCSAVERGRVAGIEEHLVPAILAALGEARACALLRTLHDELDRTRIRNLVRQLYRVGAKLIQIPRYALFPATTEPDSTDTKSRGAGSS